MNKVIDKDNSGMVRYTDLNLGDMFQYGKMGDYCMKTSKGRLNLMTEIVDDMDNCILVMPKKALLITKE